MAVADYSFKGMDRCGVMCSEKIGGAEGKIEGFQSDKSADDFAQTFTGVY